MGGGGRAHSHANFHMGPRVTVNPPESSLGDLQDQILYLIVGYVRQKTWRTRDKKSSWQLY